MHDVMLVVMRIVITFCAALLTAAVVPWLRRLCQDARHKSLAEAVKVAVMAAEQTVKGSGQGAAKKDKVTASMADWLLARGISVTYEELDGLIEAAVYGIKSGL